MNSEDGWRPIDAKLPPVTHLPLDRLQYHESATHVYIVATNALQKQYRFLKLSKDNTRLEPYLDPNMYTKAEVDGLLSCLKAGGKMMTSGRAKGILGFVRFTQGYYIVFMTRRRLVARIGPHRIYEARGTTTVSLCEREEQSFFSRRRDEDVYREQFCTFDTSQYFYYSHTYDLTNTLQTNMITPVRPDGAVVVRAKFLWNEYLLKPVHAVVRTKHSADATADAPAPEAAEDKSSKKSSSASSASFELLTIHLNEWSGWVVQAIRGCVAQFPLECPSSSVLLTIIGRTSKNFAGARYLRRGVNDDGHVANYVEVEQIVIDTASLVQNETKGLFSSYVQVRGSVPVHWHHPMVQRPKPPIKLGYCDPKYPATQKHFAEIIEDLGAPVIVVNLLKSHEKKTREGVLTMEYVKALRTIARDLSQDPLSSATCATHDSLSCADSTRQPQDNADIVANSDEDSLMSHSGESSPAKHPIRYVAFDLRNSADRAWNYMTCLAERECDGVDMFACTTSSARLQCGVVRSNCVDCIDRTNMAQFFFGLHALGRQLQYIRKLYSDVDLSQSPTVYNLVLHMYLLLGDSIAIQYGGSAQVGAGLLHRGLAWDKIMGIKRLYNNIVVDKDKQMVTNLFLGLYQPCPSYGPGDGRMRLPLHRIVEKRLLIASATSNSNSNGPPASSSMARDRADTRKEQELVLPEEGRVIDVGEVESDYYLHVPYGPQNLEPPPRTWLKDALGRYNQRVESQVQASSLPSSPPTGDSNPVVWTQLDDLGRVVEVPADDRRKAVRSMWFLGHSLPNASDDEVDPNVVSAAALHLTNLTSTSASAVRAACLSEGIEDEANRVPIVVCAKPSAMTYFESGPDYGNRCELVHNHRQFVDEVLSSRHQADRKALERLCDTPIATSVLDVMKMACLLQFGHISKWNVDTFIEALEDVEPDIHPRVFMTIKKHHVDVNAICRSSFDYIPDKRTRETLVHFVKLVRNIPPPDETGINNYLSGPAELAPLEFAPENVAFPERSTNFLQQFFTDCLQPSSIQRDIVKLVEYMTHPTTGVRARDCVRYRDRHDGSTIPEAVVMRRVFLVRTLEQWLVENSARCGLIFHLAAEKAERNGALTLFVRWLTQAAIIIKAEVPHASATGLTVSVVHIKDLSSDSVVLFTFRTFVEPVLVEPSKPIVVATAPPPSLFDVTSPSAKSGAPATTGTRPRTKHAEEILVVPRAPVSVDSEAIAQLSATAVTEAFNALSIFSDEESSTSSRNALLKFPENYCGDLQRIDLSLLSDADVRISFFINVFNILFVHSWLLASQRPAVDLCVFYWSHGYKIGGHFFSLADLKHGILRCNRPGPTSFLPQFLSGDPRLALARVDERKDSGVKILLGLIDTYLAPDKITDVVPYDPTHFEVQSIRGKSQSFIEIPSKSSSECVVGLSRPPGEVTEDGFDLIDRPPSDDSSGDEVGEDGSQSPMRAAQRSAFFSGWFRAGKKTNAVTHFCIPLYGTMLWKQLESIEEKYIQAMSDPSQPHIQIMGGAPYLRMVQPLIGLEEVGLTPEDATRSLSTRKKAARPKGTSMSESRRKATHSFRRKGEDSALSPL